jgi:hypothetical protein
MKELKKNSVYTIFSSDKNKHPEEGVPEVFAKNP